MYIQLLHTNIFCIHVQWKSPRNILQTLDDWNRYKLDLTHYFSIEFKLKMSLYPQKVFFWSSDIDLSIGLLPNQWEISVGFLCSCRINAKLIPLTCHLSFLSADFMFISINITIWNHWDLLLTVTFPTKVHYQDQINVHIHYFSISKLVVMSVFGACTNKVSK